MCFLDDGMTDIPGLRGRNDGIMIGMVNDMRLCLNCMYLCLSVCKSVILSVFMVGYRHAPIWEGER